MQCTVRARICRNLDPPQCLISSSSQRGNFLFLYVRQNPAVQEYKFQNCPSFASGQFLTVHVAIQAVQGRPEGSAPVGRRTGLTQEAEPKQGPDGEGTAEPDQDMQDAQAWEDEMRETAADSFVPSRFEAAALEEGKECGRDEEGAKIRWT